VLTSRVVIGEIVGGYRVESRLGQGATGEVFLGAHASVGTKAAIKVLAPGFDPANVKRYLKEAVAASRIGNTGTIKISDSGMPQNSPAFLVMEVLHGETLAERIRRVKRMSATQIAEMGRQIAAVLAAMHDENLVHRDLRPEKIFFTRESGLASERVKILVGDALLLGPTSEPCAPYAAPELWRGEPGDWRVDIYALGCIFFEMATGQRPYSGKAADLGPKHLEYAIPQARSLMPDVPPTLDGLIARLVGKQVVQRPRSMREVSRELDSFAGPARPLAPTATDTPVLVVGELNAPTLNKPIKLRAATPDPTAPASNKLTIVIVALVALTVLAVMLVVLLR
jgi:serine/threonine-protein kinase